MDPRFQTTRWSVVLSAGEEDSEGGREALAILCESYWYPLYAHARRRGADPQSAQDEVQDFFAALLEKGWVEAADPERGRFRSFLLTAFNRHRGHAREADRALKRGAGRAPLSIDRRDGERLYGLEPARDLTPEGAFDRRWALTLLRRVQEQLAAEQRQAGRERQFEILGGYLFGSGNSRPAYRDAAASLGVSEGSVKVAVHRLRKRYRDLLRATISETVDCLDEVDHELRHLLGALAG